MSHGARLCNSDYCSGQPQKSDTLWLPSDSGHCVWLLDFRSSEDHQKQGMGFSIGGRCAHFRIRIDRYRCNHHVLDKGARSTHNEMKIARALLIGALSGWLFESFIMLLLASTDTDRSYQNRLSELLLFPFLIGRLMIPVFIFLAFSVYYFRSQSRFWDCRSCLIIGFSAGSLNHLFWQVLHSGITTFTQLGIWFVVFTAGMSAALSFCLASIYLRKIQTEPAAPANP